MGEVVDLKTKRQHPLFNGELRNKLEESQQAFTDKPREAIKLLKMFYADIFS